MYSIETLELRRLFNAVTGFTLINSQTDVPVATLTDGATINLADFPGGKLNVRADTDNAGVNSVKFGLDRKSRSRVENSQPYALFGDDGGDYRGGTFSVGSHTLKATPYARDDAKGKAGSGKTIVFRVINVAPPQVTQFLLIDADTDQVIEPIDEGDSFNLATLPTRNLNIEVKTAGATSSVRIRLDGLAVVENASPWAYFGNTGGDFNAGALSLGAHALTATGFTADNASGASGAASGVNFTVVDEPTSPQEWQDGDVITHSQGAWGGTPSGTAPAAVLQANYNSVYAATFGVVEVGIPGAGGNSISITSSSAALTYLPSTGPAGPLTIDHANPSITEAGGFGGEVLGLTINVDFSDAGITLGSTNVPFGDLTLRNFTALPLLNGLTVRQYLAQVNSLLGGGTASYTIADLYPVTNALNSAFSNGTPTAFAQEHLFLESRWDDGEVVTFLQADWGTTPNGTNAATLLTDKFLDVYPSALRVGIVGAGGTSMTFTLSQAVLAYLPTSGPPAALNANLLNPVTSPAGLFGGEVVGLQLNVDFADANLTGASFATPFGDLLLQNFASPAGLNGLTVRQFLASANVLLGGGTAPYTIAEATTIAAELNAAFMDGAPSAWAQAHLFEHAWNVGDFVIHTTADWGDIPDGTNAAAILVDNFDSVYLSNLGVLEVGVNGAAGFSMLFEEAENVLQYLPAFGAAGLLDADLLNPTSSASGVFGSDVVALALNVDFSDRGLLAGTSSRAFGDLLLRGLETTAINGMTVRQFLAAANTLIGGGASPFTVADLAPIAAELNSTFFNGMPSAFAREHLVVDRGWA